MNKREAHALVSRSAEDDPVTQRLGDEPRDDDEAEQEAGEAKADAVEPELYSGGKIMGGKIMILPDCRATAQASAPASLPVIGVSVLRRRHLNAKAWRREAYLGMAPAGAWKAKTSQFDTQGVAGGSEKPFLASTGVSVAINGISVITNGVSVVINGVSVITNRVSFATEEVSVTTNEVSVTTNEVSVAINEVSVVTNGVSVATEEVPVVTGGVSSAREEVPWRMDSLSSLNNAEGSSLVRVYVLLPDGGLW